MAISEQLKWMVEKEVNRLIGEWKAEYIQPPPEDGQFSHLTDIRSKWRGSQITLFGTYQRRDPSGEVSSFEAPLCRVDVRGYQGLGLAYLRHTGKWETVVTAHSLDEALTLLRQIPVFAPG